MVNDSLAEFNLSDVFKKIDSGENIIFLADYGVGKSMLMREIFFKQYDDFRESKTYKFPIAINLRDHLGQDDPVELLERHARHNGQDPQKLVAAWSAGFANLLIDGFDELSTRGWTGDHKRLREFRRSSHAILKKLIKSTPSGCQIVISGRDAYFDSPSEMREVLGTPNETFSIYKIQPFDVQQAKEFLKRKGVSESIPDWAPTRPLFLNYLIGRNLLDQLIVAELSGSFPEGNAWASLLNMIAERESDQSEGVDKQAILDFLAALAYKARQGKGVDRSFPPSEMDSIFYSVTGNTVSEEERKLLLRLPGLGIASDNISNRSFVDQDFMNVCAAYGLVGFLVNPYLESDLMNDARQSSEPLNPVGLNSACAMIEERKITSGAIKAALDREVGYGKGVGGSFAYDIFACLHAVNPDVSGEYHFEGIDVRSLDLCQDFNRNLKIRLGNCIIDTLIMPPIAAETPKFFFFECLIGKVDGRSSQKDIDMSMYDSCEFSDFGDDFSVNSEIMSSSTPIGVKILVVTLRKIYSQIGNSRLESALLRGLDHRARMLAPEVIELLIERSYISEFTRGGKRLFSGNKAMRKSALSIITSPSTCGEAIVADCLKLA